MSLYSEQLLTLLFPSIFLLLLKTRTEALVVLFVIFVTVDYVPAGFVVENVIIVYTAV